MTPERYNELGPAAALFIHRATVGCLALFLHSVDLHGECPCNETEFTCDLANSFNCQRTGLNEYSIFCYARFLSMSPEHR